MGVVGHKQHKNLVVGLSLEFKTSRYRARF